MAGVAGSDWKYIPVPKLREFLAQLPDDTAIHVNHLRNLVVIRVTGKDDQDRDVYEYLGIIDPLDEDMWQNPGVVDWQYPTEDDTDADGPVETEPPA